VLVHTGFGTVRGRMVHGVARFAGLPYARAGRFAAPRDPDGWTGVRDAGEYGPSCPQPPDWFGRLLPGAAPEPESEDCLVLNVWAPSAGAEPRPVLVWLHGGLFAIGSGSWPLYDGARLAAASGCVVVTVNHRLDLFGFLRPTEDQRAAGFAANPGLLDLVAALRWVRDQIPAFGGDPARVTVFGQSGGAGKVSMLLAMPSARGLFHRAILQSGARPRAMEPAVADARAGALLDALGTDDLRSVPAERLVEAGRAVTRREGIIRGGAFLPYLDEDVLPRHPVDALGDSNVPLLMGCTADEATVLHLMDGLDPARPDPALLAARAESLGLPPESAYPAVVATETEQWRRADLLRMAAATTAPVYRYEFEWRGLGAVGATHGAELPFVFQRVGVTEDLRYEWERLISPASAGESAMALQKRIGEAWAGFAATGTPEPSWPPFPNFTVLA
jgi:para-nitrobenzyl esterase